MPRPNILFFFSDQQRWDTVGAYGSPLGADGRVLAVTPNLDRMAVEGVRFEHAFTCQPVCGPARACLQTGRYATEVGCYRNGIALPLDAKTIAHHLSDAGYQVGYIGKWHLASTSRMGDADVNYRTLPVPRERRGGYVDHWLASDVLEFTSHSYDGHMFDANGAKVEFPEGRYRVDAQTDWVLDYLRERGAEQKEADRRPFFLFVSYIEPHHQNDRGRYEGPMGSKERFAGYHVPGDLEGTGGDWRESYPDYLGCIHSLDENLGRIRAELERWGMGEETLILYTSDHGSHFRTRNSEYKRSCHEASIRVPMVACGPGFRGGRVVEELVSLIDVPPTFLAAGGVQAPETMRGRPLQPLVDGTAGDWRQEVFVQISESQVGRALRTARWKYGVTAPGKQGGQDAGSDCYMEQYLYDLESDPHERANLVGDAAHVELRATLAETLKRGMAEAGEAVPIILPQDQGDLG